MKKLRVLQCRLVIHTLLFLWTIRNLHISGEAGRRSAAKSAFMDFPEQTNVEFVRVISTNEIEIRIFERGVGPTTSSGTGTCATAVATMVHRGGATHLLVRAPGGEQQVDWLGGESEILLTGPAE